MNTTQLPLLLRILRELEFLHKLGQLDRFFAKKLATCASAQPAPPLASFGNWTLPTLPTDGSFTVITKARLCASGRKNISEKTQTSSSPEPTSDKSSPACIPDSHSNTSSPSSQTMKPPTGCNFASNSTLTFLRASFAPDWVKKRPQPNSPKPHSTVPRASSTTISEKPSPLQHLPKNGTHKTATSTSGFWTWKDTKSSPSKARSRSLKNASSKPFTWKRSLLRTAARQLPFSKNSVGDPIYSMRKEMFILVKRTLECIQIYFFCLIFSRLSILNALVFTCGLLLRQL